MIDANQLPDFHDNDNLSDDEESAFAAIATSIGGVGTDHVDRGAAPLPAPPLAHTTTSDPDEDKTVLLRSRVSNAAKALVMDDVISEITELYLDQIDPAVTGVPAPHPSVIKRDLLTMTNQRFDFLNVNAKGADRIARLKTLSFSQVARVLTRLHRVVKIAPSTMNSDQDYDLLAVYADSGVDEGIYITGDDRIRALARRYNGELASKAFDEMMLMMREIAPRVTRCLDPNLILMNNGIFHYDTNELTPFDPEYVFLAKNQPDIDFTATSPVFHNDEDGTDWEVEAWMKEFAPDDPEVVELLWQIIGAIMRPTVRWNKSAWFYSEQGNNGKGTLCELMRNMVGTSSYASIPLADFGKEFLLEPLTHASAIIVDENDVGTFIDKAANLKAIVTNDVISINRKHKAPINYQFWGFMVQCLNEFPLVKDKSESFYRRQLFVEFAKSFTGMERKYIKNDYLSRKSLLDYVAKRVLIDMPMYYSLSEPAATRKVLDRFKEDNDPVRAWWNECEELFRWDLLPFTFLYDHFKGWFAKNNPSGKVLGKRAFMKDLLPAVRTSTNFYCSDPMKKIHTGSKMSVPELMILDYQLDNWKRSGYAGRDLNVMCTPTTVPNYRGLERYTAGGTSPAEPPAASGQSN